MSEQYERPTCPPILVMQAENYNKSPGKLTDCPICHGKGYIMKTVYYDDVGYWNTVMSRCSCYQLYLNKKLIKKYEEAIKKDPDEDGTDSLGSMLEKYTFDNYKIKEDWQNILKEKALTYNKGWFFVGGQSGSGKTHICTAMTGRFLNQGISTIYMPWGTVARRLKSIINEPEYDTEVRTFKKPKVLYIDDLWKVKSINGVPSMQAVTDSDVKIAFDILNYRYINNLMTIISTEFYQSEIAEIDAAIGGRIIEMCKQPDINWFNIRRDDSRNWRVK